MAEFVGQLQILEYLEGCSLRGALPRLLILLGPPHSGKRTLAEYISRSIIKSQPTETEPGIDGVRAVIETAYKATAPTCYIFPDCQDMSAAALNAMLKVTEEPPRQAYFILTSTIGVLETLQSRGCVMRMQPYTPEQLQQFTTNEHALQICTTPGAIVQLGDDAKALHEFCVKFVESVAVVSGVNAFKIPGYLKLKDDQEGHDLHLFFDGVKAVLADAGEQAVADGQIETARRLLKCLHLTSEVDRNTQRKSVRKDSLVDMWILDVRAALKEDRLA